MILKRKVYINHHPNMRNIFLSYICENRYSQNFRTETAPFLWVFHKLWKLFWIHQADGFVVNKRLLSLVNIHTLFVIVMELHPVYVKGFSGLSYPARTDLYSDSPYKIWRNISNRIYLPKPFFRGKGKSWIWRNFHNKYRVYTLARFCGIATCRKNCLIKEVRLNIKWGAKNCAEG